MDREEREISREISESIREAFGDLDGMLGDLGEQLKGLVDADEGPAGEPEEATFTVGGRPKLSVTNVSGQIRVQTGEDGVIHVRAERRGSSSAQARTGIDIQQVGDEVVVRTRPQSGSRGIVGIGLSVAPVDYVITVPKRCDVRAKGVSADVDLGGLQGSVAANTVSGDIALCDIHGTTDIQSVSGDVTATLLVGHLTLRTTSGDVQVRESDLESFNTQTVSGDLVIETPLNPTQHYFARTVSGDLNLRVPPETGATIQMKTVSGDVSVQGIPAEIVKSGKRRWQGRIGGGGAHIEMNSVSGDLSVGASSAIGRSKPTTTTSSPGVSVMEENNRPAPPPAPPASDETPASDAVIETLKALERGEITLDEAMERLRNSG